MALDIIGHINTEVTSLNTEEKAQMLSDICSAHNYQEEIEGEPNPETKKQFGNRMIKEQILRWVNGWRKSVAIRGISIDELDIN